MFLFPPLEAISADAHSLTDTKNPIDPAQLDFLRLMHGRWKHQKVANYLFNAAPNLQYVVLAISPWDAQKWWKVDGETVPKTAIPMCWREGQAMERSEGMNYVCECTRLLFLSLDRDTDPCASQISPSYEGRIVKRMSRGLEMVDDCVHIHCMHSGPARCHPCNRKIQRPNKHSF